MDHQKGFVVGVSGGGRPIERTCDHFAVIDHSNQAVSSDPSTVRFAERLQKAAITGVLPFQ